MAIRLLIRAALLGTSLVILASCGGGTPLNPVDPDGPPPPTSSTPPTPFLIGNTGIDRARAITIDAAGAIWVAGSFEGTVDFDPSTATTVPRTSLGGSDLFVATYSTSGALIRVVTFGGTGEDRISALRVDASGSAWIGGAVSNGYLCPGIGTTTTVLGATDLFVARLDPSGTCQWIAVAGASGEDEVLGLALDAAGNVGVTGAVSGAADFDPSAAVAVPVQPYGGGGSDLFLASYGPGGAYRFAVTIGNEGAERGESVVSDAAGDFYISTTFTGTIDTDPTVGTRLLETTGGSDGLLARYSASGALVWSGRLGGIDNDEATAALTVVGTELVAGLTVRGVADLDPGPGVSSLQAQGGTDAVIARYALATGALTQAPLLLGGVADDAVRSIAATSTGALAVAGRYAGTIDLDPTNGVLTLQSSQGGGLTEAFHLVLGASGTPVWAAAVGNGSLTSGTLLAESAGLVPASDGTFWAALSLFGVVDADPAPMSLVALAPLGNGDGAVLRYSATGALQR